MKSFLIKILIFLIPLELILLFHLVFDPFRIIFEYEDYYKNSFVAKNRGEICYRTFIKNREEYKFNSFIFGNSRSQAFKCVEWEKRLNSNAKAFHFDASGEGLFGVQTKINFIDEIGDNIDNALVIFDADLLSITTNNRGYFAISPPKISKEPRLEYYSEYITAGLDFTFLIGYLDYSIFGNYRNYMKKVISRVKYRHAGDPINADIFYGNDKSIKEDSSAYYRNLIAKGVFYERNSKQISNKKDEFTEIAFSQLKSIKSVFDKHGTDYNIIISPLYDQIPLDYKLVNNLKDIFGEDRVFNFSGKNALTEPISNFYESSHYRPKVANEIMDSIYSQKYNIQIKN